MPRNYLSSFGQIENFWKFPQYFDIFLSFFFQDMHWLHVYPNSDFSALFWKNFGQFSAVIWQIFWRVWRYILEIWLLSFFGPIFCTWQTFSIFLAKFWHIFGKKEGIGRLLEFSFCFVFWMKSRNGNSDLLTRSQWNGVSLELSF